MLGERGDDRGDQAVRKIKTWRKFFHGATEVSRFSNRGGFWQCCSFDDKKGSVNREASFFSGTLGGLLQMAWRRRYVASCSAFAHSIESDLK